MHTHICTNNLQARILSVGRRKECVDDEVKLKSMKRKLQKRVDRWSIRFRAHRQGTERWRDEERDEDEVRLKANVSIAFPVATIDTAALTIARILYVVPINFITNKWCYEKKINFIYLNWCIDKKNKNLNFKSNFIIFFKKLLYIKFW